MLVRRAHQKIIRDQQKDSHLIPQDFSKAEVREITFSEAKTMILEYEWLGTMGSTQRAFGLFFDGELAGVECFGRTSGSHVATSICGPEYAHLVTPLSKLAG
jgi:hypothetical protein